MSKKLSALLPTEILNVWEKTPHQSDKRGARSRIPCGLKTISISRREEGSLAAFELISTLDNILWGKPDNFLHRLAKQFDVEKGGRPH